jgi:hypothetical protein
MKYLKLFESMDKLYKQISFYEYEDYKLLNKMDLSYRSIIEQIAVDYLGNRIINKMSGDTFYNMLFYIKIASLRGVNDTMDKIYITLFEDEYIIVIITFTNVSDRYYLCDGRDGLKQFLENNIYLYK